MTELLEISDQLLDDTADTTTIPALQARRRHLMGLKNALQQAQQLPAGFSNANLQANFQKPMHANG